MDNNGSTDSRLTPSGRHRDLQRHAEGNCWKMSSTVKACVYPLIPSGKVLIERPKSISPTFSIESARLIIPLDI